MPQNPTRQVVGSRDGAWDFSPGFHPLPHRTGREVFPHPALRQPSSWSIQDTHCLDSFNNLPYQVKPFHVYLLALKYSLRWSSRDLSCGVIGLTACTVTYFLAEPG